MLNRSKGDVLVEVDRTPRASIVTASGELDATTAGALDEHLLLFAAGEAVVLDLTGVTFCDSVGIACVLAALHRGVDLRVVGSRRVSRVLALVGRGLEERLHTSVAEALAQPAQPARRYPGLRSV
ncbi:STAS domain-containing protein [Umezawaea sp.]|uniref:STAS domain-containing protein n=1 Tax=Umezawaea sp. TaxID=1955258 RepID=UPI002ED1B2CF